MTMRHSVKARPRSTAGLAPQPSSRRRDHVGTFERLRRRVASLYEVSDRRGRVVPLEGARGVAVLLVFFVHFHTLFSGYLDPHSLSYVASNFLGTIGNAGVDLFFALSGYLLYGVMIQKPIDYETFLRRRVGRIYPTFLCVFSLYLFLSWLFPEKSRIPAALGSGLSYVVQNLLFLPGIFDVEPMITV